MTRAIVSLGSNIEPRREYLERALDALAAFPGTRLAARSSIIETDGIDVPGEFAALKFLNMAAVLETSLAPEDFSRRMHAVEDALGRRRTVRNGPRTIDIDILDYQTYTYSNERLILPHPRVCERDFVVKPLLEILPGHVLSDGTRVGEVPEEQRVGAAVRIS